jgi:thiol-disulfide isomerase/thioredoxin
MKVPNTLLELKPYYKWLIFGLVGMIVLSTAFNVFFGLDLGLSNKQSCPTVTPVPTVPTKTPGNNTTKPTATPTPTTKYTILFFTQPNCPYCELQAPKVCAWADAHTSRITLQKVDLYQDSSLSTKYGVRSTPTTIIIDSSSKALKTWVGEFDTAEMTTWLSTH